MLGLGVLGIWVFRDLVVSEWFVMCLMGFEFRVRCLGLV